MIDHCVSTIRKWREEESYKVYVTDVLRQILVEVAEQNKKDATAIQRFSDMAHPKQEKKETRTAEEVVDGIKERLMKMGK